MTFLIDLDEGTAARRRVPIKLFTSDGTSPDTGASGDSLVYSANGGAESYLTVVTITAADGMYYGEFAAVDVGTLGTIALWHRDGDFAQHVANVNVVNYNPMSSQSNIPLVATVTDVTNDVGVVSSATIAGVTNVSVEIAALNDIDGSGVTLHAGVHSSATIQGVELVDLTTANTDMVGTDGALQPTVAARTLDVTVGGTAGIDWSNVEAPTTEVDLSATTVNQAATIGAGGILSTSYAAGARDAAGQATDAVQENADGLLDRDMATGADSGSSAVRTPRDALRSLRNRVDLSENTLTVFEEDDVTEAWRASLTTTGDSNFPTAMDPSG